MKKLFSWKLIPSEAEFNNLWENAFFVFDTNFLLNLYRVSRNTSDDFLKILELFKDRIWLPYQVVDEYLDHREETIKSEAESFEKVRTILKEWKEKQVIFSDIQNKIKNTGRILASELESLFDEKEFYTKSVEKIEELFSDKINKIEMSHAHIKSGNDEILERLILLFDDKVGQDYDADRRKEIYEDGAVRYSQKLPPGFADDSKSTNEKKYGDLIIWKQILDFSKENSKSIIFITGDTKDDWWIRRNGEIVAPLLPLRKEFSNYTGQDFWMYTIKGFLQRAQERSIISVNQQSIEETNKIAIENEIKENISKNKFLLKKQRKLPFKSAQKALRNIESYLLDPKSEDAIKTLNQYKNSIFRKSELENAINTLNQYKNSIFDKSELESINTLNQYKNSIFSKSELEDAIKVINQYKSSIFHQTELGRFIKTLDEYKDYIDENESE